jgi:hypothetical protein
VVGLPDGCLEPLATGVADCDVWKYIVVVIWYQGVGEEFPERMVG